MSKKYCKPTQSFRSFGIYQNSLGRKPNNFLLDFLCILCIPWWLYHYHLKESKSWIEFDRLLWNSTETNSSKTTLQVWTCTDASQTLLVRTCRVDSVDRQHRCWQSVDTGLCPWRVKDFPPGRKGAPPSEFSVVLNFPPSLVFVRVWGSQTWWTPHRPT